MPIYVPFVVLAAMCIAFGWAPEIPIKTNIRIILAVSIVTVLLGSIFIFGIAPLV